MKLMRISTPVMRGAMAAGLAIGLSVVGMGPISAVMAAPAGTLAQSTTCVATYVVQPGDTLSAIAVAYNVQWTTLATANALSDPELIYAGQTLCIPAGASVPAVSAGRIVFPAGATATNVTGTVLAGQARAYVLWAGRGQPMMLSLASANNDVTLTATRPDGLMLTGAPVSNWQGWLPLSGDYVIDVQGGTPGEAFTLTANAAARIQFAPGAVQASFAGDTAGGFTVQYVAYALKGQTMSLTLSGVGGNAVLTVWGFQDGQPYLRYVTEQTSFSMRLPASEDYIIGVYPRAGMDVPYSLTVKIQ